MRRGVDFSWARPRPSALADAGFTFACRYLSHGIGRNVGKNLTESEALALSAAGIDIVLNWENEHDDFRSGVAWGALDAAAALQIARTTGAPADPVIYFSIDADPRPAATLAVALEYLRGVGSVLGTRFGVYGGLAVVKAALDAGLCTYAWETYAWSGGQWDPRAQLRQVKNTQTVDGAPVDFDEAHADDFGQWRISRKGTPVKVSGIPYVQGRNSYSDPDGTKYGIAIHNTSNNAPASGEASYATRRTDGVSAHFYVDGGAVIQSLDTAAKAGHAGSSQGNDNAVAVEIVGTNDKSRQWWLDNVAWDLLGRVLAQVCQKYAIPARRATVAEMRSNPKIRAFYSHNDMRLAWGGTTHDDPGTNFPWDRLFNAVTAALGTTTAEDNDMTPEQAAQLKSISDGLFYGGGWMGPDVDPAYKQPEPTKQNRPNSIVAQLAEIRGEVKKLQDAPALPAGEFDEAAFKTMLGEAVQGLLPAIAKAVADEQAKRQQE